MRRTIAILLILVAGLSAGLAAGCGDNATKVVTDTGSNGQTTVKTVPDEKFAKTKFVIHAGLAYGAFHRWIYKPYKAGTFKKGADGRTKALVKAGAAGAFALVELREAKEAAQSDDTLRNKVVAPMEKFTASLEPLVEKLKSGKFDPADIAASVAGLDGLKSAASAAGIDLKPKNAPIP